MDLLPQIGVGVMEGDFPGQDGKTKFLVLSLGGIWKLDIQFVVEKLRKQPALLDLAIEAVARNIKTEKPSFVTGNLGTDHVDELEIPVSLHEQVRDSLQDLRWLTTSSWNEKLEKNHSYSCFK